MREDVETSFQTHFWHIFIFYSIEMIVSERTAEDLLRTVLDTHTHCRIQSICGQGYPA